MITRKISTLMISLVTTIMVPQMLYADTAQHHREHSQSNSARSFSHHYQDYRTKAKYIDKIRVKRNGEIQGRLAPQVRITSPLNGGTIALGRENTFNGAGFTLNLEILTRDGKSIRLDEATQSPSRAGIRRVEFLKKRNPDFPGLFVTFDTKIITPFGETIPKNTNLAPLFNIAGTDDTPGKGVTAWASWHVLESLPVGTKSLTITAAVEDEAGRIGFDKVTVDVANHTSGNELTPDPSTFIWDAKNSRLNKEGPKVEIIAPRVPSAVTIGPQRTTPTNKNASLTFIQVNTLSTAHGKIAVDEVGNTVGDDRFGPGSIVDAGQLGKGRNNNFPGLFFSFDADLKTPAGEIIKAGKNLAPVFNTVGSEIDPLTGTVRVVASWVVGGSIILKNNREFVTFTAKVTDNNGKAGISKRRFRISETIGGQQLTLAPQEKGKHYR